MTIRKTLLISFLLVSLIPSILLTSLAFLTAGDAMREEISHSLLVQSATVSSDVDKMLFERVQNALTWKSLEVMQDAQIKDVDKRLANFLAELKFGYRDVYDELLCIDPTGKVIASSKIANIGKIIPVSNNAESVGSKVFFETLDFSNAGETALLPISIEIASSFNSGKLAELRLMFNWAQIYHILDQAAEGGRLVVLLDGNHRVIAASKLLRQHNMLFKEVPGNWLPQKNGNGFATIDGTPFNLGDVIVGYSHAEGFQHFQGLHWTALVIQPSELAFVPVKRMALVFLALLAITSSFAIAISLWVTGRIARPITALTHFTRQFMRDKKLPPEPKQNIGEVGELTTAFIQTVRDLEQSQQDLIRASKLAVLGEMAAVMAHEVRTPLGILKSSAQMLAREPNISDEAREFTGFIESETERLNRLVSTLLDSSRPRPLDIQQHDINALIRHSLSLLNTQANHKKITLESDIRLEQHFINCDAEKLTQVLLNLILNAIQILPVGGRILVGCTAQNEQIRITVADDGAGIPAENWARVFDPFFTKREGGVGLGLSVVQQIVSAHHGQIFAGKSELGGALFTILLPEHRMKSKE